MIFTKKPDGIAEWDGYQSESVSPNRKPLSKEEEDKIAAELRENVRKILKNATIRKEPLYKKKLKHRKNNDKE